jgi:molybdopterin biosynthesis enzyme
MLKPPHSEITQTQAHEQSKGLPVATVQSLIQQHLVPLQESETVALTDALNRVLATDIISPIHVPAHDNAAMDGYALRSADLANSTNTKYQVVGLAVAGKKFTGTVQTNECIRIMTGAQMPDECDTVIPQELITLHKQESEETLEFKFDSRIAVINFVRQNIESKFTDADVYNFYFTKYRRRQLSF